MDATDTTPQARQVLIELYRRMSPEEKLGRVFDAYQMGKMLAMAGIRDRYPGASEKKVWLLWARQHLGEELFSKAYGAIPDE